MGPQVAAKPIPSTLEELKHNLNGFLHCRSPDGSFWAWYRIVAQILLRWSGLLESEWIESVQNVNGAVWVKDTISQLQADSKELADKDHTGIAMYVWNWVRLVLDIMITPHPDEIQWP